MSGARTAGGLICSHGSDLDTRIPRAKMPKSALPQSLRIKLGFEKKNPRSKQMNSRYSDFVNPYAPGANVLKPRESSDGRYKAGCQKNFLRRGSGSSFSSLSAQKKIIENFVAHNVVPTIAKLHQLRHNPKIIIKKNNNSNNINNSDDDNKKQ